MIIEVNNRWHYNAPTGIMIGDEVELPRGGFDRYNTPSTWIGKVTDIPRNFTFTYDGDIRAIVGKVEPQQLTITAKSKAELRLKLQNALDDLDDR